VGISLWTSCIGALALICEGSANLRVCVDPFQTIGLKRKRQKGACKVTVCSMVWSFFPWSCCAFFLLISFADS
jgi:hypothetical protein